MLLQINKRVFTISLVENYYLRLRGCIVMYLSKKLISWNWIQLSKIMIIDRRGYDSDFAVALLFNVTVEDVGWEIVK